MANAKWHSFVEYSSPMLSDLHRRYGGKHCGNLGQAEGGRRPRLVGHPLFQLTHASTSSTQLRDTDVYPTWTETGIFCYRQTSEGFGESHVQQAFQESLKHGKVEICKMMYRRCCACVGPAKRVAGRVSRFAIQQLANANAPAPQSPRRSNTAVCAAEDVFRRFVSCAPAKRWVSIFDSATWRHPFALMPKPVPGVQLEHR